MSFIQACRIPIINEKRNPKAPLYYCIHQSYFWQVALQQSLLPLQIDKAKFLTKIKFFTNHFCPHYRFFVHQKL